MKSKLAISLFILTALTSNLVYAKALPKGAIKEGSLSNQKLIGDAKAGVAAQVATQGCNKPEKVDFFVMQQPQGEVGSRYWKELWVVEGCKKSYPIKVKFQEDTTGATWIIEK